MSDASIAHAGEERELTDGFHLIIDALKLNDEELAELARGATRRLLAEAGLPPAHVGIHAGPVIFQEGDYYGSTVNLASRIADRAGPGQVFVSGSVAVVLRTALSSRSAMGRISLTS